MPKTISFVGAKGGSLKSSSVVALGHLFAAAGLDVTLVDADPQGTLTRRSGLQRPGDPLRADPTAINLPGAKRSWGRMLVLPGGRALEAVDEARIGSHLERAHLLGGDVMIIDTPPALGPLVQGSIRASDLVVVPCPPGLESLEGYGDMAAAAESIAPDVTIRALVVLAHLRSRILRWTLAQFEEAFPGARYEQIIPTEMAAAEAGTLRLPVTLSAPRARATLAYRSLAASIAHDLQLDVDVREVA